MPETTTRRAVEELEERQAAVREAQARIAELEAARRESTRAVEAAKGPLLDYYERLGAGEGEEDPELERRLLGELRDIEDAMVTRTSSDGDGKVELTLVDERVEAKLAGARRALEQRRAELEGFVRRRFDDLVAELAAEAREARDRFDAAWAPVAEAEKEWYSVLRRWAALEEVAGIPRGDAPPHPLGGLEADPGRGVPLPMPPSLVPRAARSGA